MKLVKIELFLSDRIRVTCKGSHSVRRQIVKFDTAVYNMSVLDIQYKIKKQTECDEVSIEDIKKFLKSKQVCEFIEVKIKDHNNMKNTSINILDIERVHNIIDENVKIKKVMYDTPDTDVIMYITYEFNGIKRTVKSNYGVLAEPNNKLYYWILSGLMSDIVGYFIKDCDKRLMETYMLAMVPHRIITDVYDKVQSLTISDSIDSIFKYASDNINKSGIAGKIKLEKIHE